MSTLLTYSRRKAELAFQTAELSGISITAAMKPQHYAHAIVFYTINLLLATAYRCVLLHSDSSIVNSSLLSTHLTETLDRVR